MIRLSLIAGTLTLAWSSMLVPRGGARLAQGIVACNLVTAHEASTAMGMTLAENPDDVARGGRINCRYNPPGNGASFDGLEITVRQYADAASAHAAFPKWVVPVPPLGPTSSLTTVPGVGDEAKILRTPPQVKIAGIYFRHGAVLVKIGTYPAASDTALTKVGQLAASRL